MNSDSEIISDSTLIFHRECELVKIVIVETPWRMLVQIKVNLNSRNDIEKIPFLQAYKICNEERLKTVEFIIKISSVFNIELTSVEYQGKTPLDGAKYCDS